MFKVGAQAAIGGKGRRFRQQNAGQVVEVAQRVAGEFQPQIEPADIKRIADRAAKRYPGITRVKIAL